MQVLKSNLWVLLLGLSVLGSAQMPVGLDTLVGNEWIEPHQTYLAFPIANDGFYSIEESVLRAHGVPIDDIEVENIQLWAYGKQIPFRVAHQFPIRIEFWAEKNKGHLDQHIIQGGTKSLLHPEYSLISDTAMYYLTWSKDTSILIQDIAYKADTKYSKKRICVHDKYEWQNEHVKPYFKIGNASTFFSSIQVGEGFARPATNEFEQTWELDGYEIGEPIDLLIRGLSDYGDQDLSIIINGEEIFQRTYRSFELAEIHQKITVDTNTLKLEIGGLSDARERFYLSSLELEYPRALSLPTEGHLLFSLEDTALLSFPKTSGSWFIYHFEGDKYYQAHETQDSISFYIETEQKSNFVLFRHNQIRPIEKLESINFLATADFENANYIIISHPELMETGAIDAYGDYRSSVEGGGYQVGILDVRQIYHTFGYGVDRHPVSFRNLAYFLEKKGAKPYLFLIGKGREYAHTRTGVELEAKENQTFYLPTFGVPGSDNLLLGKGYLGEVRFPIGRLAAETGEDIWQYLEKVERYESELNKNLSDRKWKKKLLHLEGGGNLAPTIQDFMSQMESTLNLDWSPQVFTFSRSSNSGIERPIKDDIFNEINEGVGWLTFFGHSATNNLDFDINNPEKYQNGGKMPFLLALGCNSGNFNTPLQSVGELYTSFPKGGFIASMATSGLGETTPLFLIARSFYARLDAFAHRKSVATLFHESLKERSKSNPRHTQQLMYYGDPALFLTNSQGPDYLIEESSISIPEAPIDATADSFDLHFELINQGNIQDESLEILIEHQNQSELKTFLIKVLITKAYQEINIRLPLSADASGNNELRLTLDPENRIEEWPQEVAEENNSYIQTFFKLSNGVSLDYPLPFAIHGDSRIEFVFSSSNPLAEETTYYFQLDTVPFKDTNTAMYAEVLPSAGGLIRHSLPMLLDSGEVYYWRVGVRQNAPEMLWKAASFIYLPDRWGWNQSEQGQYLENPEVELKFIEENVFFQKAYQDSEFQNAFKGSVRGFNGVIYDGLAVVPFLKAFELIEEGIGISVFDTVQNFFQPNPSGAFGSVNSGGEAVNAYVYPTSTEAERKKVVEFLQNGIPENAFVYVFTIVDQEAQGSQLKIYDWLKDSSAVGSTIVHELERRGAAEIRQAVQDTLPLYLLGFESKSGKIDEAASDTLGAYIRIQMDIQRRLPSGRMRTVDIPVSGRQEVSYDFKTTSQSANDRTVWKIIEDNTTQNIHQANFFQKDTLHQDFSILLELMDSTDRSSPELNYIRVYHDVLPDFAFLSKNQIHFSEDRIFHGDTIDIKAQIVDIQNLYFGELEVLFEWIQSGQVVAEKNHLFKSENQQWTAYDQLLTENLSPGKVELRMRLNPELSTPEINIANNVLVKTFYIQADVLAPHLEVWVNETPWEQRHPIGPGPEIRLRLSDFNSYFPLDSSLLDIKISKGEQEIDFSTIAIQSRSQNGKQELSWRIQADIQETGLYDMRVQAKDALGNSIAPRVGKLLFERRKQQFADFRLVPNPTSDHFRIAYKLEGESPIEKYELNIYNGSGIKVLSLDEEDFGGFQIGPERFSRSFTSTIFKQLPQGVYFYKLKAGAIERKGKIIKQ